MTLNVSTTTGTV